jgi:prevent-host-death family protein
MKSIDIAKAVEPLADYAESVDKEAVVVTKNGKPVAVLSSAKGMDAESIALANNPRFAAIIQRSRARHAKEGGTPLAEVYRRLRIKPRAKRGRGGKGS